MENILKQILGKLESLEVQVSQNTEILNTLDSNVSKNTKQLELIDKKVDIIDNKVDNLEAHNAERHVDISRDIKFMKHKMHETEEDVFIIKDQLKLVK